MIKLLDEKGLTTVWAAIKNTFTSKSDADGKYAKKADLEDYIKKGDAVNDVSFIHDTDNVQLGIYNYDGDTLATGYINAADYKNAGVMSSVDKNKLDGIDSGANNYKLPIASINSRGGIKTGYNNNDFSSWAVKVDNNANAYVTISGLYHDGNGAVSSLNVISPNASATYNPAAILFSSRDHGDYSCGFPTKDGTFALTSDCGLLVMNGGIVNNNISFNGYKQNVLISASGNYNISNWYNSSPVGSVIDIYPYGEINGTIVADNKYIFQMMGTSSSGLQQIVTKKSINLSSDHYIRLIHISDGVYVCVSVLGY